MALVLDLKPGERVLIGEALITNEQQRTRLNIDGKVPILREKDILVPAQATSPCQKLYLTLQLMYMKPSPADLHDAYFDLVRQIIDAAPSMTSYLLDINEKVIAGSYYRALKEAKKLIKYETELMANV
jgi:flagellar protein FlbT